ncbi:MAG: FAD/NAD(P)-binding oxidoreductase [Bryobacteraceae bacterium]
MTDRAFDILVIGAGPAGLAAACRAAECGAKTAVVDENRRPGGQIWRASAGRLPVAAQPWVVTAGKKGVEWIPAARVFAAPEPGRLALENAEGEFSLTYRNLILATGARERFLPFPGWTLPNVMGAGGLQALVKSGLPIERKKIIVAGTGPLLLAVAQYLRTRRADVRLIAEQAPWRALARFAAGLPRHPEKLMQTAQFTWSLAGVKFLTGCWPVAAEGEAKVESVTLARGGQTWSEPCDCLACGFGLIPNTELAALLGCRIAAAGVEVDEFQRSSLENVYAAGEITGIGGVDLAVAEGEIAGFAAAGRPERARRLFHARATHRKFAAAMARAFALREELKTLARTETLICRCEDVPLGRIHACSGWRDAKLHTRCGMGPCQGRVCGGALEFLLGWKAESVRPPVLPVRVASLIGTEPGEEAS